MEMINNVFRGNADVQNDLKAYPNVVKIFVSSNGKGKWYICLIFLYGGVVVRLPDTELYLYFNVELH